MDTTVLDAINHGPAFVHSLTTERRLTCEAPRAEKRSAAGSSEISIALILQPDRTQGPIYSQQVF